MSSYQNLFVFNRFPINKECFFNLIDMVDSEDASVFSDLYIIPRTFDKIYFTMTARELRNVAHRRGDPKLADYFPEYDAIFSIPGRCIVLHIPAMSEKISSIPLRADDPEGKILFTIYLFRCLFHELGHAHHFSEIIMNAAFSDNNDLKEYSDAELEDVANEYNDQYSKKFFSILRAKHVDLKQLADQLFYWPKLKPLVSSPRDKAQRL